MKRHQNNFGFAPLLVILIVALFVGAGGVYYTQNKKPNVDGNAEMRLQTEGNMESENSAKVGVSVNGTFRSLFAIGRNVSCTFTSPESSGIVYITADGKMSGDFSSKTSSGSKVESHMIRSGDTAYVWNGSQGAKMDSSAMMNADASAQAKAGVDLDNKVDYKCTDWNVDESEFTVPSNVSFVDISAMMKGNMKLPIGN